MVALAKDRSTPERGVEMMEFPFDAGAVIYRGAMVGITAAGAARPAGSAPGLTIVGRAENGTADFPAYQGVQVAGPAPMCKVRRGRAYAWANSAGTDTITQADYGKVAYAVDDQTVAKTDGSGSRSPAGTIRGVDAAGVWVQPA